MKLFKKTILAFTLLAIPVVGVTANDAITTNTTVNSATITNKPFVGKDNNTYSYKAIDKNKTLFIITNQTKKTASLEEYNTFKNKNSYGIKAVDLEKMINKESNVNLSYSLITKKDQFLKRSGYYTERRVYSYANGINTKYTRYYGARTINNAKLNYTKTMIQNKNTKGKTTSLGNYTLSQLWNERYANVRTSLYKYSYYGNGRVKQKNSYFKNVATNRFTTTKAEYFRSNGKRSGLIQRKYNSSNKMYEKRQYVYNRAGQLKSNKYGKAYRHIKRYNNKGKRTAFLKYKYNARGAAKRYR